MLQEDRLVAVLVLEYGGSETRARPAATPSLLVSACDKLHNGRAIVSDLHGMGNGVFERFKAGREGTLWYYGDLARIFTEKDIAPAASPARSMADAEQSGYRWLASTSFRA